MSLHDILLASAMGSGFAHRTIPMNTDLNHMVTPGVYLSDNKTSTASMQNTPAGVSGHGFALEVFYSAGYPSVVQRLTWGSYNQHVPHCTIRCGRPIDGVMTWGNWYELNTTVLLPNTTTTTAVEEELSVM